MHGILIADAIYFESLTLPKKPDWILGKSSELKSKCTHCGELHDDEDCELIQGLVFCGECLNAFEKWGDGIEEEIKQHMN